MIKASDATGRAREPQCTSRKQNLGKRSAGGPAKS